jgi:putative flippase GtrA
VKVWHRFFRFNAVGALGIVVQLVGLAFFKSFLHLNYLVAAALAVEAAVIHNFLWHERWTWKDRSGSGRLSRFLRFNSTTGTISVFANVALMRLFVGEFHMQYLVANLLSIGVCALANFLLSDRFVFKHS